MFELLKDTLIKDGVVFFGGYASYLYSKYMPNKVRKLFSKTPDFDVLSNDIVKTKDAIIKSLKNYNNVNAVFHKKVGEIIPKHYEILIGKDTLVFIYKTIGCHSYN